MIPVARYLVYFATIPRLFQPFYRGTLGGGSEVIPSSTPARQPQAIDNEAVLREQPSRLLLALDAAGGSDGEDEEAPAPAAADANALTGEHVTPDAAAHPASDDTGGQAGGGETAGGEQNPGSALFDRYIEPGQPDDMVPSATRIETDFDDVRWFSWRGRCQPALMRGVPCLGVQSRASPPPQVQPLPRAPGKNAAQDVPISRVDFALQRKQWPRKVCMRTHTQRRCVAMLPYASC